VERLKDPEYLGWRHERVTGDAYYDFVDQFVQAVKHELPDACLQWEELRDPHARPLLERYRDQLLTFNDDIQSTAAVALGAILGAVRVAGTPLKEQRSSCSGPAPRASASPNFLCAAMPGRGTVARGGTPPLLVRRPRTASCTRPLPISAPSSACTPQPHERVSAWASGSNGIALADVIRKDRGDHSDRACRRPTARSPKGSVREMARKVEPAHHLPVVQSDSKRRGDRGGSQSLTDGRALVAGQVATGSAVRPVSHGGREIPHHAVQQHLYLPGDRTRPRRLPAARRVTDAMILAAARALGEKSAGRSPTRAALLPALPQLRMSPFTFPPPSVGRHSATGVRRRRVTPSCVSASPRRSGHRLSFVFRMTSASAMPLAPDAQALTRSLRLRVHALLGR